MPLAKAHLLEGQYDSARIGQLSKAIQDALIEVLGLPPVLLAGRGFGECRRVGRRHPHRGRQLQGGQRAHRRGGEQAGTGAPADSQRLSRA